MFHSALLLILVLVSVGLFVLIITARLMAEAILRPPRMTDGKAVYLLKRLSPGDLQLPFTEERLQVRDNARPTGPPIELAAWWIPATAEGQQRSDRCVVFLHGYADAKVGCIAWAPAWHSLGFNILAVDLRAHGESDGRDCTAGYFERHDINELLDRLRSLRPEETRSLILLGISMGAAVALATAVLRDDLAAVVIDSPFADYRSAVRKHMNRIGLPSGMTASLAIWLAQMDSGAKFADVAPLNLLRDVPCPVMMIRGELDDLLSEDEVKLFVEIFRQRSARFRDAMWDIPSAIHMGALHADADEYAQQIEHFLKQAWSPQVTTR